MDIWQLVLLIAVVGAVGGIANCAITGEFVLPQVDTEAKAWRPGWVGNVVVGAVAAVVVWGVNGPLSQYDIIADSDETLHLTLGQLLSSIVVGLGGGNILTQMAQKQAERVAKETLASSLRTLLDSKGEDNDK